jgi:hypothetical protein
MGTNTLQPPTRRQLIFTDLSELKTVNQRERVICNETQKPTAYISYPMTGYEDLNYETEQKAFEKLRIYGYWVYLPSKMSKFVEKSLSNPQYKHYMGFDLWSLSRVDVLFICKGWEDSDGCKDEIYFALRHKIPIIDIETMMPFDAKRYENAIKKNSPIKNLFLQFFKAALCVI